MIRFCVLHNTTLHNKYPIVALCHRLFVIPLFQPAVGADDAFKWGCVYCVNAMLTYS